jgi:tetratricopeptide (TPR) repeat protein
MKLFDNMKKLTKIPKLISYIAFRWTAMRRLDKLWISKEYQELISFCNLMLTKNSTDYSALYYRGLGNEELKQFDLAIEDFKASETLLTTYKRKSFIKEYFTKIPIQISRVYRKKQNKEKAFEYANKAVQADKEEIAGLIWRASLKEDIRDNIGALEDLNEALKRRPTNKVVLKMRDRLTYIVIQSKREAANC